MDDPDRLLRRINFGRGLPETTTNVTPITDHTDDIGESQAFGWLRGVKDRANMLELRFLNGISRSFAFAWLFETLYDPSEGIDLDFGSAKVKLQGRNLGTLHSMIQRHRVIWIVELDPLRTSAGEGETLVSKILVREGRDPSA